MFGGRIVREAGRFGGHQMTVVAKVWIDEDCITCDACQDIAPEVFEVTDETSQILTAGSSRWWL